MGEQAKKARKGDPASRKTAKQMARGANVQPQGKLATVARKGNKAMPLNPNAKKK
jgi:hypothetical protein